MNTVDYPKEWDELPKRERKNKIKKLKKKKTDRTQKLKFARNIGLVVITVLILGIGYRQLTKKSPEEIQFESQVEEVSLDGRVEEFEIEGTEHIRFGDTVDYNTNPPTSGPHYAQSAEWGFYQEQLPDEQLVHNLEHGGIWISYKSDLGEDDINNLKSIADKNGGSVIVTERPENDDPIAVSSWGRVMRLDSVNDVLIQKYIDTYINHSPEKLAH